MFRKCRVEAERPVIVPATVIPQLQWLVMREVLGTVQFTSRQRTIWPIYHLSSSFGAIHWIYVGLLHRVNLCVTHWIQWN